jgi:hypothetical protein
MQIFDHGVDKPGIASLRIEIFVAKDQRSGALRRSLRRNPEGTGVAEM